MRVRAYRILAIIGVITVFGWRWHSCTAVPSPQNLEPRVVVEPSPSETLIKSIASGSADSSRDTVGADSLETRPEVAVGLSEASDVGLAEVRGVVRLAESGSTIAQVDVYLLEAGFVPIRREHTRTDNNGRFRFASCRIGAPYFVDVVERGRIPFRAPVVWPTEDRIETESERVRFVTLEILVPAGVSFSIQVTDAESDLAIGGASVKIGNEDLGTTAADGSMTIRGMTSHGIVLSVIADHYCVTKFHLRRDQTGARSSIPLVRGASIRGRVTDSNGLPLSGVVVYGGRSTDSTTGARDVLGAVIGDGITIEPRALETVSTTDGSYVLDGLTPAREPFILCARIDRDAIDTGRKIRELNIDRCGVELVSEIEYTNSNVGRIDGSVVLDRRPVAASIRVHGIGVTRNEYADAAGRFAVLSLPAGHYEVEAEFAGVRGRKTLDVEVDGLSRCDFDLRSREPTLTRGRIVSETRSTMDFATLDILIEGRRERITITSQGEFQHEWFGAVGATATIRYNDPFQSIESEPIVLGTQSVEIRIRAIHRVQALVRSATGSAISDTVRLAWRDASSGDFRPVTATTFSVGSDSKTSLVAPAGNVDLQLTEVATPHRTGRLQGVLISMECPVLEFDLR